MKMIDTATRIEMIRKSIVTAEIRHAEIEFPITANSLVSNAFIDKNGLQFGFTQIGAGYFYNHLKEHKIRYAVLTEMVRKGKWQDLADLLNGFLSGKKFIASFFMGNIVGANVKYNEIPHEDIMADLINSGLSDLLYAYNLTQQELNLYISDKAIETDSDGNAINTTYTGMIVTNGHSGHSALSFRAYFKSKAYEFRSNEISSAKARHLSNVIPVYQKMAQAFATVRDFALTERLRGISFKRLFAQVIDAQEWSTRQEAVIFEIENDTELNNALDVIVRLSGMMEFSKKSGIEAICDTICEYAMQSI